LADLFQDAAEQFLLLFIRKPYFWCLVWISGQREYHQKRSHLNVIIGPKPFLNPLTLSFICQFILERSCAVSVNVLKRFKEKTGLRAINNCIVERSHSAFHSALKPLQEQLVFCTTCTFTQELSLFYVRSSINHSILLNPCADMRKFTVKKNSTLVSCALNPSLLWAIYRFIWKLTQQGNPLHVIIAPIFCCRWSRASIWNCILWRNLIVAQIVKRQSPNQTLVADIRDFTLGRSPNAVLYVQKHLLSIVVYSSMKEFIPGETLYMSPLCRFIQQSI